MSNAERRAFKKAMGLVFHGSKEPEKLLEEGWAKGFSIELGRPGLSATTNPKMAIDYSSHYRDAQGVLQVKLPKDMPLRNVRPSEYLVSRNKLRAQLDDVPHPLKLPEVSPGYREKEIFIPKQHMTGVSFSRPSENIRAMLARSQKSGENLAFKRDQFIQHVRTDNPRFSAPRHAIELLTEAMHNRGSMTVVQEKPLQLLDTIRSTVHRNWRGHVRNAWNTPLGEKILDPNEMDTYDRQLRDLKAYYLKGSDFDRQYSATAKTADVLTKSLERGTIRPQRNVLPRFGSLLNPPDYSAKRK